MVFCTVFFLRHTDMGNPSRWSHATSWVFALVDNYLSMGRANTSNWRPDGWIFAALEVPTLALTFDLSDMQQKVLYDCVKANFFDFGLSPRVQSDHQILSDLGEFAVQKLNRTELRLFQNSALQFAVSLLIGISLLAAVLKNAFHQWKEEQNNVASEPLSLALIKLHVSKIFDLAQKSEQMDLVLRSLHAAMRSSSAWRRGGTTSVEVSRCCDFAIRCTYHFQHIFVFFMCRKITCWLTLRVQSRQRQSCDRQSTMVIKL